MPQIASNWSLMCLDYRTPSTSAPKQSVIEGVCMVEIDDVKVGMEVWRSEESVVASEVK